MNELIAPQMVEFEISKDNIDSYLSSIYFDMEYGSLSLNLFADAIRVETKYEYQSNEDPQSSFDRDAYYFKLDKNSKVYIDGGDLDNCNLSYGQVIKLTEKQLNQMNELLEMEWKWC